MSTGLRNGRADGAARVSRSSAATRPSGCESSDSASRSRRAALPRRAPAPAPAPAPRFRLWPGSTYWPCSPGGLQPRRETRTGTVPRPRAAEAAGQAPQRDLFIVAKREVENAQVGARKPCHPSHTCERGHQLPRYKQRGLVDGGCAGRGAAHTVRVEELLQLGLGVQLVIPARILLCSEQKVGFPGCGAGTAGLKRADRWSRSSQVTYSTSCMRAVVEFLRFFNVRWNSKRSILTVVGIDAAAGAFPKPRRAARGFPDNLSSPSESELPPGKPCELRAQKHQQTAANVKGAICTLLVSRGGALSHHPSSLPTSRHPHRPLPPAVGRK